MHGVKRLLGAFGSYWYAHSSPQSDIITMKPWEARSREMRQFGRQHYYCGSHVNEHCWMQRQLITACIITLEKVFNYFLMHSVALSEPCGVCSGCKMDPGREPAKLWFHCLMAIVLAVQMAFLDRGDALRTAIAEVTPLLFKVVDFSC